MNADSLFCFYKYRLSVAVFEIVFVFLDHLLDHLSAYRTSLTSGDVTVITIVEIYSYFISSFHLELGVNLELIKCRTSLRNYVLVTVSHFLISLYKLEFCFLNLLSLPVLLIVLSAFEIL